MFWFNKIFLFMIALAVSGASFAQTTYESPHVKDGKTIQLTLPSAFFPVSGIFVEGMEVFTTSPNKMLNQLTDSQEPATVFTIMHFPADVKNLDSKKEVIEKKIEKNKDKLEVIEFPKVSIVNGLDVLLSALKGEIEGEKMDAAYFCVLVFGDYTIFITYEAEEGIVDVMKYEEFKKIISSCKEIETEKEDQFNRSMEYTLSENMVEYKSEKDGLADGERYASPPSPPRNVVLPRFENSLFETKLEHSDVKANLDDSWAVYVLQDKRLLSQFNYRVNKGSVKVFSGGDASNYATTYQMGIAFKMATGKPQVIEFNFDSELASEHNEFKLFTILGNERSWIYTTEVDEELVFFVIEGDGSADFKKAVNDFMLTMWVENFGD